LRTLDLTTLRSFVAVADTGGITRAANLLNLTQSAVSMQMRRLEDSLGQPMLEKVGRGIALTPAGDQLLGYERRMLSLNDEAMRRLTDSAYEGQLTLGVPSDIVYPHIPGVLKRFHIEFPRMRVNMVSSFTRRLLEQFEKGELDVTLTTEDGCGE
jgi:DNA-binding transcriptional LysR family regulator